jgi:hypothetical protein
MSALEKIAAMSRWLLLACPFFSGGLRNLRVKVVAIRFSFHHIKPVRMNLAGIVEVTCQKSGNGGHINPILPFLESFQGLILQVGPLCFVYYLRVPFERPCRIDTIFAEGLGKFLPHNNLSAGLQIQTALVRFVLCQHEPWDNKNVNPGSGSRLCQVQGFDDSLQILVNIIFNLTNS